MFNLQLAATLRHIIGRNDVFWRILCKNPFTGVRCSDLQEPKKALKTSHPRSTSKSRIWGAETPKPIATIFACWVVSMT